MAEFYATSAGAGNELGGDWDNAFPKAAMETWLEDTANAGDILFIRGDITIISAISTVRDGTAALPITVRGVKAGTTNTPPVFNSTYGSSDFPVDADRPILTFDANSFTFDDQWIIRDLIIIGTAASTIQSDQGSIVDNCKVTNTSSSASRVGVNLSGSGQQRAISTEVTVPNSSGARGIALGFQGQAISCYVHDCNTGTSMGVQLSQDGAQVINCVLDNNVIGVEIGVSAPGCLIFNNTFFDCGTCVDGNTAVSAAIINNIFTEDVADGIGVAWDSAVLNIWLNHNAWDMNVDVSNATKGEYAQEGDPGLNDPGAGDFSITSTDTVAFDKGLDVDDFTGATV